MRTFLPGWGSTAEVWTPFVTADDLVEEDAGGAAWPETATGADVVAWSLGAMRALEAALAAGFASLTLVAASGRFVRGDGYPFGWPERTLTRMRARLADAADAVLDEFWSLALAPGEEIPPPPRERDPQRLDAGLRFLAGYSMLERAHEIRCPVRLLHGGHDRICPLEAADELAAALPQAELTVWPESGHAPFLAQPDRFRSWLNG